jgi:hypothetical protein
MSCPGFGSAAKGTTPALTCSKSTGVRILDTLRLTDGVAVHADFLGRTLIRPAGALGGVVPSTSFVRIRTDLVEPALDAGTVGGAAHVCPPLPAEPPS